MDIQTEKIELVKKLLNTDDERIIRSVKKILDQDSTDFWNDLSANEQREIEEADLEIEQGKVTDFETFIAKYRS
jgi:hypothetical protein